MKRDTPTLKEKYRERLKKIIGKKFETTMIYPLSQFEAAFGHLWKHTIDKDKLTDDELVMRKKWEECRNNILNMGNHQKRNCFHEVDMHDVVWRGYETHFVPVNRDNGESNE